MKTRIYYFIFILSFSGIILSSCQKDSLTQEETAVSSLHVYNDSTIKLPIEVVAGNNRLLSAYFTRNGKFQFMMTDNEGKLLWSKQFGITSLTAMLAENDGTYSIFSQDRLINFNEEGTILKDDPGFLSAIPYNTGSTVSGHRITHVFLNKNGNYLFYGALLSVGDNYGFAAELNHDDGALIFRRIHNVHATITGCQMTSDGGYLFLGNTLLFTAIQETQRFFLVKLNSAGEVVWSKKYFLETDLINGKKTHTAHEIIETNDGNYLCFISSTANISIYNEDKSSRIYKVTPEGNLIDSTFINYGENNIIAGGRSQTAGYSVTGSPSVNAVCNGYGVLKKNDGSIRAYFMSGLFGTTELTASIVNGNHTFYTTVSDNLEISNTLNVQNIYYDCINSICITSDGKIAAFGLITSFDNYYKPVLMITD